MANFWERALSKITFWDQSDDRRIAQQDEEEKRRQRQQQAARSSVSNNSGPRPTVNIPGLTINNPSAPQQQQQAQQQNKSLIASQSDFKKPNSQFDLTKPLVPAKPIIQKKPVESELDRLTEKNMDQARKDTSRGQGFWGSFADFFTGNNEKIAKQNARNKAVNQYQEKHGYNKNPDVMEYLNGTKRLGRATSEDIKKQGENLNKFEKGAYKAAEVAQYVPITGSVLNLGLAGAEAAGDKDIRETRNKIDFGMTNEEYDALDDKTKGKLQTVRNIGLAASPLDFLGVGGVVKSEGTAAAKKAIINTVKKEAIDEATKAALKKAVTGSLKKAAVPAVLGAGVSAGAQEYLTGEVDPVEAAKSGLLVGGTSLLTPATQTSKIRKSAIEGLAGNEELKAASEATSEATQVPGRSSNGPKTAENPTVEIAPGVKVQDPETRTDIPKSKPEAPRAEAAPTAQAAGEDVNVPTRQGEPVQNEPVNVPDPSNPIALAPVNEPSVPRVVAGGEGEGDVPMADFTKAMDVPLRRVGEATDEAAPNPQIAGQEVPQAVTDVPPEQLPVSTGAAEVTPEGNPTLQTDARAIENGTLAPASNPSLAATEEAAMQNRAAQAAEAEVNNQKLAAPRTFERMAQQVEDPAAQKEILDQYPTYDPVSIKDEQAKARTAIGQMSPEELVDSFKNGVDTSTPSGFYQAYFLASRLGRSDVIQAVPGAKEVATMAANAVAASKSAAGQSLGLTRILFENMPPVMKRDMLIDQLGDAGKDMQDADRDLFLRLIERTDDADSRVGQIQDEATAIKNELTNNPGGADADALNQRFKDLDAEYQKARTDAGSATADAVKFYETFKPKGSIGGQVADVGRGLMLSGIGGRVFDNLSTASTAVNDVLQANASAGVGKVLNKVTGNAGEVIDSGMSLKTLAKGTVQGGKEVLDSFRGKGNKEASLESFARGEENRSGVGDTNRFNRFVNNVVDIPTKLSKGIENARAEQLARQEASQLGLTGKEGDIYAKFSTIAQSDQAKHDAVQYHMRTNNLHQNAITDMLNGLTRNISGSRFGKEHPQLVGAMDVVIKNQVAPFTSFLGGNAHRALTDKNMLYNVTKGFYDLSRGNLQGFADQVGNAAVNATQAMAVGYTLSAAGVLTDTDANGDDYAGVYIHIGDRYIPVSILGAASVPIIFGQAAQSAQAEGEDPGDIISKTMGRAVTNTFASAGVASVFGGENNLQQTISTLSSDNGDNVVDPLTKYGSSILRQYVNPAIFGDVNAAANNPMPFGLNPNATGMAPQVDATKENADGREVKDVQQTELNRIMAGIPGVSQTMDRNTEKTATDLLDRGLKSTRETGEMTAKREQTETLESAKADLEARGVPTTAEKLESLADSGDYDKAIEGSRYRLAEMNADPDATDSSKNKLRDTIKQYELRKDGVPVTEEGFKARMEDGDYNKVVRGLEYKYSKIENDPDVATSTKRELKREIGRTKIYDEGEYDPDMVKAYESSTADDGGVGVTMWRQMMDSDDPKVVKYAEELEKLDKKMVDSKLSNKQKYYWRGGRGGSGRGRGGRGGRSGSSKKGISTDIALQTFEGGFTPIKPQAANFSDPQSAIPILQRVKNNDRSKEKKITVSKGA